jgi:hypothetical protein
MRFNWLGRSMSVMGFSTVIRPNSVPDSTHLSICGTGCTFSVVPLKADLRTVNMGFLARIAAEYNLSKEESF